MLQGSGRRRGVSTFISVLLYLSIVMVAVGIVLNAAIPMLDRMRDTGAIQAQVDFMNQLDDAIREVASEGAGSTRVLTHTIRRGTYRFNPETGQLYYELETDSSIISTHASRRIGALTMSAGADVFVQQDDVNGTQCIRMKTSHLSACIRSIPKNPSYGGSTRGYWLMDDRPNGTVQDDTRHGHDGTFIGESFHHGYRGGLVGEQDADPTWGDGWHGPGLEFDGVDDLVNLTNDSATQLTDAFTVSAWIRPEEDCSGNRMGIFHPTAQWILRCEDRSDAGFGSAGNTFSPGIQLQLLIDGQWYVVNATIPTDEWVHVAGTFDGTTEKLYVNGTLRDSFDVAGPVDKGASVPHIGAHPAPANFFNGSIDELRVWDHALSPAGINASMRSPWPANRTVASYSFAADDGQVVHDTHEQVQGVFRGGRSFDGSDDRVNMDVPGVVDTDTFTLSFWVKPQAVSGFDHPIGLGNGHEATVYLSSGTISYKFDGVFDGGRYETGIGSYALGQWQHVAVTYNGSMIRGYVNGEFGGADTTSGSLNISDDDLVLGADAGNSNFFNGSIDGVRVYNRSLLPRQVAYQFLKGADEHYVNTSTMLVSMRQRGSNRSFDGTMFVQINGSKDARTGRGHTTARTGTALPTGTVTLAVNETGAGRYNVSYEMLSGSDFLTVQTESDATRSTVGLEYALSSRAVDDKYIDGVQRGDGIYTTNDIDFGSAISTDGTMVAGLVAGTGFTQVGFDNTTTHGYGFNVTAGGDSIFLLPYTQGTARTVHRRKRLIKGGVLGPGNLFGYPRPSFGYPLDQQKTVQLSLSYDNILLDGFERSTGKGTYRFIVTNNGAVNGKANVSVTVRR